MTKTTAPAAGEAMPADTLNRRAALGALARIAALAVPAVAVAAPGSDLDAPLFELLDRWRAARAHAKAADESFWEADERSDIDVPPDLIVTQEDHAMFYKLKDIVGRPFGDSALDYLAGIIGIIAQIKSDSFYIQRIVDRYIQIRDAHREYYTALEAARRSVRYYELEAAQKAALAADETLRREVTNMRARTVPGLLAKIAAIADDWAVNELEQDAALEEGEVVSFERVASSVIRDGLAIMNGATA